MTTRDGVYGGRVVSLTPTLLRLKWGAGMWDVDRRDLITVKVLSSQPYSPAKTTPQEAERQAARIMGRWS